MTTGEEEEASSSEPSHIVGNVNVTNNQNVGNNSGPAMDISANLSCSILPLLQMQPVNNLTKHDIHNLVKTILNMEPYILNFDLSFNRDHIGFFAPFVALSTNCIITNASAIPKSQVQLTSNACSVLIQYILHYLQICDERSLLTKLQLITLLQGLCDDVPPLTKSDIISLCAIIKSSKVPADLCPRQNVDVEKSHLSTSRPTESEEVKESKRIRLDHTCDSLIEQLMTPIVDLNRREYTDYERATGSQSSFTISQDSKSLLMAKNLLILQQMSVANAVLDFILNLPLMMSYIQPVHAAEEGAPLKLPSTVQDAMILIKSCKVQMKEYEIIRGALSLPILEPLTEDRLNKVITIIHTCLYISLTMVTASSILSIHGSSPSPSQKSQQPHQQDRDQDSEAEAVLVLDIINVSIKIYHKVMQVMKNSVRVGGHVCQNAHLFACWMLLNGIKNILNLSPPKNSNRSSDSQPGACELPKMKQGYSSLCIPLATHAVLTFSSLLEDLKQEMGLISGNIRIEKLASGSSYSFKHNKFGSYSAWQRIEMLMSNINIVNLLFGLASVSYRRAGSLRSLKHQHPSIANQSIISSTSSDQPTKVGTSMSNHAQISDLDDDCCFSSDDSSRDEDSEPILKQLFKENEKDDNRERESSKISAIKPRSPSYSYDSNSEKKESHSNLFLSFQVLELFNKFFVCSEIENLRQYFRATLTDQQIVILANIVKDLDRENIGYSVGPYQEFSRILKTLMHNLIATNMLSNRLQTTLLLQLGINPTSNVNFSWPLYIPPRSLSILAQVLLLRQRREKDEIRSDLNAPSLFIWQSVLNNLKKLILGAIDEDIGEIEDLNVEHAQLLLFIFHNLKLLQRKNVLLMLCQTLIDVSRSVLEPMKDYQIHFLARALHFFEYMMRYLYEPPRSLIDHVDNNLLKCHSLIISRNEKEANNKDTSSFTGYKLYFDCREVETYYSKKSFHDDRCILHNMKPRFYHLMNVDSNFGKELPKLDGMAVNFILAGLNTDILGYDTLYDSLVQCLLVGTQSDLSNCFLQDGSNKRLSYFGFCAVQYCFNIAWRLLLQMPPSLKYLESFISGDFMAQGHKILHSVIWIPRITGSKVFFTWIREVLSKLIQGHASIKPEVILDNIILNCGSLSSSVKVLNYFIGHLLSDTKTRHDNQPVKLSELPKLFDMFVLESLIVKTMITLDECLNVSETSNARREQGESFPINFNEAKQCASDLLPQMVQITKQFYSYIRWNILHSAANEDDTLKNIKALQAHNSLLRMTAVKPVSKLGPFSIAVVSYLPQTLVKAVERWNNVQIDSNIPGGPCLWRKEFSTTSVPSETVALALQNFHFNNFANAYCHDESSLIYSNASLKQVTGTLLKATEELFLWSVVSGSSNHQQNLLTEEFAKILIPLNLDLTLKSFNGYCNQAVESIWGSKEGDDYLWSNYVEALRHCYDILINYSQYIDEKISIECIKFIEGLVEVVPGQNALEKFFCDADITDSNSEAECGKDSPSLVDLIITASRKNLSSSFASKVLKLLVKLFEQTEKNPETISLVRLCSSLTKLNACAPPGNEKFLYIWLNKLFYNREETFGESSFSIYQENRQALQNLTSYIVKDNSAVDEEVAGAFLSALIPIASLVLSSSLDARGFPDLLATMTTLASAGSGNGHLELISAVFEWLEMAQKYLSQKEVLEKLESNVSFGRHQVIIESTSYILSYLSDVFEALKILCNETSSSCRPASPFDAEPGPSSALDFEPEWVEDLACLDDDESAGEESDEDSLCNKLCTFTITQKEFMNQHWYHCHTCKMVDGVGVCTVCAKVCHKDHDVTFAKYGSFFCDCGAKQDGSCLALTKRTPANNISEQATYRLPAYSNNQEGSSNITSSLRRRPSSPEGENTGEDNQKRQTMSEDQLRHQILSRQLKSKKNELLNLLSNHNIGSTIVDLLQVTAPSIIKKCQSNSPIGSSLRARKALKELHENPKTIEYCNHLIISTLGSQEGALENVRLNYTGEQGQTIRQLISSNVIRRVAMCALVSPLGKRQHLAVSHEKGKITLLQLSTLLKQTDCSKKNFILSRLGSAPIPFTVLSMASNPCNEDYLSVCGLKDCHVLTFNSSGNISGHLLLHPQLEAGNYILKSLWVPGTQAELALVTVDFVKIYDLSVDVQSPQYFFLLPSGKVRDITFVITDNARYLMILSSAGHILCQALNEESSFKHGSFFVTNLVDVKHSDISETSGGLINSGGASIYYSHTLQMLFLSYANGLSFVCPLIDMVSELSNLFLLKFTPIVPVVATNGSSKGSPQSTTSIPPSPQPLCQWSEIQGHPGLVCAMAQQSNNPVIIMVKPESFMIQEIQLSDTKSKITDIVAVRHSTSYGEMKTTIVLLCEDGSLLIFMVSPEDANYWLRPSLCSSHSVNIGTCCPTSRSAKKRKSSRASKPAPSSINNSNNGSQGTVSFPIDFFEHCIPLTDIEFGGNDVLQVYNTQQLKDRLNSNRMYVASTKLGGFTVEVTNNDPSMVIVGARILVGSQDINKAPSCIEIFDRPIYVYLTRNRWYDFPLTREESFMADKKLSIFFGASSDPNNITMVDSIKIYGKTKVSFAWPEEDYENVPITGTSPYSFQNISDLEVVSLASPYPLPITSLDRLLSCMLEVLEGTFTLKVAEITSEANQRLIQSTLHLITELMIYPFPMAVQQNIKYLLLTLHQNRNAYNNHRDNAVLNYVIKSLTEANKAGQLDGEAFYRLINVTKSIAISRPENLIKFSEFLASSINKNEPTFSGLIKDQSDEFSISQSFSDLSSRIKSEQSSRFGKGAAGQTQRSVSFLDTSFKEQSGEIFLVYLSETFWKLYCLKPKNPLLTSVASSGLSHVEATVQSLVEIILSFALVDLNNIGTASQLLMKLFLCKDPTISFGAKQSLIRLLRPKSRKRKVYIPSPPICEVSSSGQQSESKIVPVTPSNRSALTNQGSQGSQGSQSSSVDVFAQENLLQPQFEFIALPDQVARGVDELMNAGAPFLDLETGTDDEAMVELAIALSLQSSDVAGTRELPLLDQAANSASGVAATPQRGASLEDRSHYSDTTASAAASDDEGSTAATDGSTLRTSPVVNEPEPAADGGGSESGASGLESIIGEHNVSGRSSAYGDENAANTSKVQVRENQEQGSDITEVEHLNTTNHKLHNIRLYLLEKLVENFSEIRGTGGTHCIPTMQVILMLSSDLDCSVERDKNVLMSLLTALINELHHGNKETAIQRTPEDEVKLIIMRLLSILMSGIKSRTGSKSSHETSAFGLCPMFTAQALINSNILDLCLQILTNLKQYWRSVQVDNDSSRNSTNQPYVHAPAQSGTPTTTTPLKPRNLLPAPDMSPFFMKQYVKGHPDDIFEAYPELLTEMVLRLPYQVKKLSNNSSKQTLFPQVWLKTLCEYMMIQLTPFVRKHVRKLLSFICGSKEKYRQIRDFHALEYHINEIKNICRSGGFVDSPESMGQGVIISLSYDSTIVLIEHLKACCDIGSSRTLNWQKFCQESAVLTFFFQVSFLLDEGVSPTVLQLLQFALCKPAPIPTVKPPEGGIKVPVTILQGGASLSPSVPESDAVVQEQTASAAQLSQHFIDNLDKKLLCQFIQCFLLESNLSSLREQAHSLLFNIYQSVDDKEQHQQLLEVLWSLWDKVPSYGRKAGQFVDLLAHFTLKARMPEEKEIEYCNKALNILRNQNKLLIDHPNSTLYNSLQSLVELDGHYLESEPCLVCNNPEVNYSSMKLSSVKVDSRFTTTTQIVKLVGSHTISKITLRIADIKRSKMVKTLKIYYNNRAVHSVVELKNKTGIWHKAKTCHLAAGQTEVKIEFPLPIVACNLMIEYADFYENIQASSETLQCPRCSASVPANPGVCGNCGENVFQCHKCRAINYDEKDPFLCNSCGFSKYAKFDYALTAKPTFSVDPIENEEDRKKTVQTINSLLEKADRVYKGLIANKPTLELLLLRIQEHGFMDKMSDEALGIVPVGSSGSSNSNYATVGASSGNVNRAIQQVAHKYCVECKSSFDELSKVIQKVLASRKELVDYDNIQRESIVKTEKSQGKGATRRDSKVIVSLSTASGRCYGCASSVVKHCITLLNKLGTLTKYRKLLCSSGLLQELVDYNLKTGGTTVRQEVRQLLCTLTLDNPAATDQLNDMLVFKIVASLVSPSAQRHDLTSNVRHEIALLICSLEREDSCWERRLRCLFLMFTISLSYTNPAVLESITLPCLKLLINLTKPDPPTSKKNKDKSIDQIATVQTQGNQINVDLNKWLSEDPEHSFDAWKKRCAKKETTTSLANLMGAENTKSKEAIHEFCLQEKYGNRWKEKTLERKKFKLELKLPENNWVRSVLFNKFSRTVRLMACSLVEALFQTQSRRKDLILMLTNYSDELGTAGEYAQEFFSLYHSLIQQDYWKYYLALKGVLLHLGTLITKEIEKLNELEETTLNSDLSEGCALKMLVDLLTVFVDVCSIRKQYKSRLVAFILNGYLSLRKLVVQRTKIIDETQDNLLELLEEMTTGTESETSSFMAVCVEAVNKCKLDDLRTPVFIFERLCSIIYPEESDTSEFSITLEKDPQQEDFLQGRMLGNPYPSNEPGMGPLMRDIKNKICHDCELIALLEDDSGMELLVCNKIISLDLPVKEVYKKVWLAENSESEAMRIIYRMRGLMGDATEEFIQTLDSKNNENVDNEQVYKMANVMSQCGGLEVMLQRLAMIKDLSARSRPLLLVLLKLFDHCIKVRQNRLRLIDPFLKAITVLLNVLKMGIVADASDLAPCVGGGSSSAGKPNVLEMILTIMESILVEASKQSQKEYDQFCEETCGFKEDIQFLLKCAEHENVRINLNVMQLLMRVIPLLTLGAKEKMLSLLDHFRPRLDFNKFDFEHTPEDNFWIDCFCVLLHGIEKNENGNRLKDLILDEKIIDHAIEYLRMNAPPVKSALLATSEEWKEFTQRPVLKYVLRLLTGLCAGHSSSQMLVAAQSIPIIHGLEQVSSDSHVGSLAEMLLEALKYNNSIVSEKIESVRRQTREEKKRLAMAVRQKQLGELGMKANERGQVMAKSSILRQVEDLGEEQGLICIICREGYKFQPAKVLGIYTFTKKCPVEPFEDKHRKTMGYSTVTHFNVVHVDCHMAAVRHARGRDEWESAALQNANTKCNGLLPLWGPSVQESAFASCLARHNTYLQECTGHRDISYSCTVHDLKLLLLKFAAEESFSLDSGGGGPQSNIHLIPYMIHMALYVINTTRCPARESKKIAASFLELPPSKWIENSFEAEGPFYWITMSLIINPPSFWRKHKLTFLSRLIVLSQARYQFPKGCSGPGHQLDPNVHEYSVYKTALVFWGLIDSLYSIIFKNVLQKGEEDKEITCETWTLTLADYIRNNDQQLIESGDKMLRFYEQDLLPLPYFYEFCDVLQLLHIMPDPDSFFENSLRISNARNDFP